MTGKTEIITKTTFSSWDKGKITLKTLWDHYTMEGDTRTISHLETIVSGRWSLCRKSRTLVGVGEGDKFYQEGGRVEIPLKEAKAVIKKLERLTEAASQTVKAGHDITTWYFR